MITSFFYSTNSNNPIHAITAIFDFFKPPLMSLFSLLRSFLIGIAKRFHGFLVNGATSPRAINSTYKAHKQSLRMSFIPDLV